VRDECARNISNQNNSNVSFIKSLAFALAMSFHSVLEGFALGVQEDTTGAVTLFFSLLVDNTIDAFTVGLQVSRSNSKKLYLLVTTVVGKL
jgi:zinc transporter ZupT